MNKNERPSFLKGKGAAVGIVICFVAVIALVGAYTFSNYQSDIDEQTAKAGQQAEELTEDMGTDSADSTEETTTDDIVLPEADDDLAEETEAGLHGQSEEESSTVNATGES